MLESDTRLYLIERIADVMRTQTAVDARALANEITLVVSESIGGTSFSGSAKAQGLVPRSLRTYSAIPIGWEAFRKVHEPSAIDTVRPTRVIGSVPEHLSRRPAMVEAMRLTGVWPGSLVAEIYKLFENAQESLFIAAPYWSLDAVQMLTRHVTRTSMRGVRVSILTQPKDRLGEDALSGVLFLRAALLQKDAEVEVVSPPSVSGRVPLIHCKAVVQDDERAYLGSANFTVNGIDQSIELGVILGGSEATSVRVWLGALINLFDRWELN